MDDMSNEDFEKLFKPYTKEEILDELAMEIANKIMVFAIDNYLLDKDADTIIYLYKRSTEEKKS